MPVNADSSAQSHFNLIVAQRAQAIIDIAVAGSDQRFQSAILGVDTAAQTIAIDELFPQGYRAKAGQRVRLSLRLDGDHRESFDTEIIGAEADGRYLLRLPASVDYHQRRSAFRVPVLKQWARNGEFFTPGSRRCEAAVRDISPSGIRLEIVEWSPLKQGDTLEELHFELLGERYQCRASVRNIRVKGSSSIEIGAAFIDLPRPQQRNLERSLMQLQRRQAASAAQLRVAV
ncbi:MAG: hypothetical protein JWM78_2047 [Verrucomicrobiaceae bacterium]|nr:hypothetical protein [Verrucomicrobiaceae bacterium]